MSDDEGGTTIFTSPAVEYIKTKIFSTYPKVLPGAKFDKAFTNEENR
jgi:hypothetical protein